MISQQAYRFLCSKQRLDAKYSIIYSSGTIGFHLEPQKYSFRQNHLEPTIDMYLYLDSVSIVMVEAGTTSHFRMAAMLNGPLEERRI